MNHDFLRIGKVAIIPSLTDLYHIDHSGTVKRGWLDYI